jgi:hypothetical protein
MLKATIRIACPAANSVVSEKRLKRTEPRPMDAIEDKALTASMPARCCAGMPSSRVTNNSAEESRSIDLWNRPPLEPPRDHRPAESSARCVGTKIPVVRMTLELLKIRKK